MMIKLIKNVVAKEAGGNWGAPTEQKFDLFADVLDAKGFRTYEAQTALGQVQKFKTRFRFDMHPDADWKVEFRGKEWTIISIEQLDQFFWIITANHK